MEPREIAARDLSGPDSFLRQVAEPCLPVVIRGLVSNWPAVRSAERSPKYFRDYVSQFDAGKVAEAFIGEPRIAGKYYYTDDLKGFNFERERMTFGDALDRIVSTPDRPGERSMYLGSLSTDEYLPGFSAQNALAILKAGTAPRIWLGHASNVSAHYDSLDNLACVVAGTRRFTLFSPEAIGQMYVGPIDFTLAGQPVSLAASAREAAHPHQVIVFSMEARNGKLGFDLSYRAPRPAKYTSPIAVRLHVTRPARHVVRAETDRRARCGGGAL